MLSTIYKQRGGDIPRKFLPEIDPTYNVEEEDRRQMEIRQQIENITEDLNRHSNNLERLRGILVTMRNPQNTREIQRMQNILERIRAISLLTTQSQEQLQEQLDLLNAQTGNGFFLRDPTKSPPQVLKLLSKIGSEEVKSVKLIRTPLSASTRFLLNIASFGQLNQKLKEANIDQLFHLSMLINGRYELEKNEVIKMQINPNAVKSNSETLDVPITQYLTIQQVMNNTKEQMGNKYGPYDGKYNNCSVFLSNVLSANGLENFQTEKFINQKTVELFNSFPNLTKIITDLATTSGAVVDRQIQGEGSVKYKHNFSLARSKILA